MSSRIGQILREHGVAEAILSPEVVSAIQRAELAIDEQGYVRSRAVGGAVRQTATLEIAGTAMVRKNAAIPRRVPQVATKVRIDARALTPPSGGPFAATVYADGEAIGAVTITAGQEAGGEASVVQMPAGAWLTVDVNEASGATNVAIVVTYRAGE